MASDPGVRGYVAGDPTWTVDNFIGEVPNDDRRCILVYRRQHGGRTFVRWRVFHRHSKGNWYPDRRRAFVIPVDVTETLARVVAAAPAGQSITPRPPWLDVIDAYQAHRLACLHDLNAPADVVEHELRKARRGPA